VKREDVVVVVGGKAHFSAALAVFGQHDADIREVLARRIRHREDAVLLLADMVGAFARQHRDVHRRHAAFVRQHIEHDLVTRGELPLVGKRLAGHQALDDIEVLVEAVALLPGILAIADELVRQVPGADAEHETSAAHHVDHRVGLGDAPRVVEGEDRDRGPEADALGALRKRGQHHRRIGHHAVLVEMVLGAKERVETQALGELAGADHLVVELRHRARKARVVVVDRKDRVAHL
jgi:hypothetical protein